MNIQIFCLFSKHTYSASFDILFGTEQLLGQLILVTE